MGNKSISAIPPRFPVPIGVSRICVTGFTTSHHTSRAANLARLITKTYPDKYESWFYFDSNNFREEGGILPQIKEELDAEQKEKFASHKSSPFCWIETGAKEIKAIGGRDRLCEWAIDTFPENKEIVSFATQQPGIMEIFVDTTPGTAKTA